MKPYVVVSRPSLDNRVLLILHAQIKDEDEVHQKIDAPSWLDARLKVKEDLFYQDFGKGWFVR